MADKKLTRKQALTTMLVTAANAAMPAEPQGTAKHADEITLADLQAAEKIAGLRFADDERAETLDGVRDNRAAYDALRKTPISYLTEPPTVFTPLGGGNDPKAKVRATPTPVRLSELKGRSTSSDDIAFLTIREQAILIKSRKISPVDLTRIYLERLKQYGDKLRCVITLMEDHALRQAQQAENEVAAGRYRGVLHGIPYGLKDLFATRGVPTTWGAEPYKDQVFPYDAAVAERLEAAGAILLAKLSMGALAMNDVWFGGQTRNPWNPQEGSSGSSAGSACATAAGLVAFAMGTETLGSIISPCVRCRVTGLRPTYGRVSRHGAMGLSYTMDKIGPICRDAEDCALVLAAICGHDPRDGASVSRAFRWRPKLDLSTLKVGTLVPSDAKNMTDSAARLAPTVAFLRRQGATVRPVTFTPSHGVYILLDVEAASAFDEFTRTDAIHHLHNSEWNKSFRTARFIPAVEYVQAQRARADLMRRFEQEFADLDCFIAPDDAWQTLSTTNFTGHPQVVIPCGANEKGESISLSFVGRLYREETLLAVAQSVQNTMPYHRLKPDLTRV